MKKLFFASVLIVSTTACNKSAEKCDDGVKNQNEVNVDCGGHCAPCAIEYSDSGDFGDNVLYGDDTLHLTVGDYSMRAYVPEESTFEVELALISGSEWFYSNSNYGWVISGYDGAQTFTVPSPGLYDLNFHLAYSANPDINGGSFYIHYKENGSEITKTKVVVWN